MKRILFCAAVVALAAACTNEDDLVMNQDNSRAKGLTFNVTLAEGVTTRGELKEENGKFPFFWYAETDRINVTGINITTATVNTGLATAAATGEWTLPTTNPAAYKATVSSGKGQFTAIDDANALSLLNYNEKDVEGTTATVIATYGDVKLASATSKIKDSKAVPGELTELVIKTGAAGNAAQTVARANAVVAPMHSVSTGVKKDAYNSLGEQVNLRLLRLFPTVSFTTKNTKDYIETFGKLASVELTAQGSQKTDGSADKAASVLAYAADKSYTVIGTKVGFETVYAAATAPATVKVTLTDGTWTDNDAVYMTVAPVDRKAFKDNKELLKVTYEFENITFILNAARKDATAFEKEFATNNDWTAVDKDGNPNAVTPLPALDINNYNYLLTDDNTLIIVKGTLAEALNEAGTHVVWNGVEVAIGDIEKIISNVKLEDKELATIKKFTALTDLTLKENTSIPANTFTVAQAAAITNLNLPKVTSIVDEFINNATADKFKALETLAMPMYDFASAVVNAAFFNSDVDGTLKTLDMSGVASMMPTFGINRTMVFTGYALLEEVTVKDNVIVAPSAFAGCVALKTITGKLDITNASNAFEMETTANNVLKSVEVSSTVIPVKAFNNCTLLETVKLNGNTVVPTAIGTSAFEKTKVAYMDLSNATTIGASAFKGSDITSTNDKTTTLTVGATELPASIFEDCANLKMVKFTNATKITGTDIFSGAAAMVQIKFQKKFTLGDIATGSTFDALFTATPGNIDFWTNPEQLGVSGKVLTLSAKIGTVAADRAFTFKSIQMKIED